MLQRESAGRSGDHRAQLRTPAGSATVIAALSMNAPNYANYAAPNGDITAPFFGFGLAFRLLERTPIRNKSEESPATSIDDALLLFV